MADRLGQQFGNYRLISLLGQGGYAEVYLGQHVRLNQQAAIKVLHAHLTNRRLSISSRKRRPLRHSCILGSCVSSIMMCRMECPFW